MKRVFIYWDYWHFTNNILQLFSDAFVGFAVDEFHPRDRIAIWISNGVLAEDLAFSINNLEMAEFLRCEI